MKSLRISNDCQKSLDQASSQSKAPFFAGALVGQLENQTYLLVDFLPLSFNELPEGVTTFDGYLTAPNNQDGTPENRFLDLTSNAKMMLGGGLSVIGVLFSVEFQDFDYNSATFKNLVDNLKAVTGDSTAVIIVQNKIKKKDDYLLYDFAQRKFSGIDYQYLNFKDRFFKLTTTVEAEIIIPITKAEGQTLKIMHISDKLKQALKRWTADLGQGVVKIGNRFIDKADVLENIKTKAQISDNTLQCEIYSAMPIQKIFVAAEEETGTNITVKGVFTALAYVLSKKVSFKDAYQLLITDLLQSVQDKLNLFISEHEEVLQQQLAQNRIFSLPKRVHLEFPGGNLTFIDYLTSEEPLEEGEQRLKEWFNLTPKYVNTIEYDTAKEFQTKFLKAQETNKVRQQEGVSQRKAETEKPKKTEGKPTEATGEGEAVKDNNMVKIGALVGVAVLLLIVRFVLFK